MMALSCSGTVVLLLWFRFSLQDFPEGFILAEVVSHPDPDALFSCFVMNFDILNESHTHFFCKIPPQLSSSVLFAF